MAGTLQSLGHRNNLHPKAAGIQWIWLRVYLCFWFWPVPRYANPGQEKDERRGKSDRGEEGGGRGVESGKGNICRTLGKPKATKQWFVQMLVMAGGSVEYS
jgi:hypothetical protein